MKRNLMIVAFVSGGVLALSSPVVVYKAWASASGWCCETVSSYDKCCGCVSAGDGYIHVGSNPVRKCESTPLSRRCRGSREPCYELEGTQLFSDAQCTTKIGVITVTQLVQQCDFASDGCNGG